MPTASPEPTEPNAAPTSEPRPGATEPVDAPPDNQPPDEPAPGKSPCAAGFLPLLLVPLGLLFTRRIKRS